MTLNFEAVSADFTDVRRVKEGHFPGINPPPIAEIKFREVSLICCSSNPDQCVALSPQISFNR